MKRKLFFPLLIILATIAPDSNSEPSTIHRATGIPPGLPEGYDKIPVAYQDATDPPTTKRYIHNACLEVGEQGSTEYMKCVTQKRKQEAEKIKEQQN